MVDSGEKRIGYLLKLLLKLLPLSILSLLAFFVFIPLYASGSIHMFPYAFTVDNQQRLYLLFESGIYVYINDQSIRVLPRNEQKVKEQLYISHDNQLIYLHGTVKSVFDLDQSFPEIGYLFLKSETAINDKSILEHSYGFNNRDEQGGAVYTYHRGLFTYSIMREEAGESSLFYKMPRKDILWNLFLDAYVLLMIVGILVVLYQYSKAYRAELVKRAGGKIAQRFLDK